MGQNGDTKINYFLGWATLGSVRDIEETIAKEFEIFDTWMEKYEYIIEKYYYECRSKIQNLSFGGKCH